MGVVDGVSHYLQLLLFPLSRRSSEAVYLCVCAASGRQPGDIVIERTGIPGFQFLLCRFYWNRKGDDYRIPEHISSYLTSETVVPEFLHILKSCENF